MVKWGTTPLHHDELGTPGKHPVHRLTVAPPHKLFAIDTGVCNKQRLLNTNKRVRNGQRSLDEITSSPPFLLLCFRGRVQLQLAFA
jgi:hypothetical protein